MNHYIKNIYWDITEEYNKEKLLYLLIDRPDEIHNIYFIWENNKNQDHRNYDLPACVWHDGEVSWWKNHKYHRENNKPAYIRPNGYKEYWSDGKRIKIEHLK